MSQTPLSSMTFSCEIFVSKSFCEFELSAVVKTLSVANQVVGETVFDWHIVSAMPGLVSGEHNMLVRADPVIPRHGYGDVLVVVGGSEVKLPHWSARMREMQRLARPCLLLSDAATAYLRRLSATDAPVTTHWRDAALLVETHDFPGLSGNLSETSAGITTAAGAAATCEHMVEIITPHLSAAQRAEVASLLMLAGLRSSDVAQPKDLTSQTSVFPARVHAAIRLMEHNVAEPLSMAEINTQIGVTSRHLERLFATAFGVTPARFYKRLRTQRAHQMIVETVVPLIEVALATGFPSNQALATAVRDQYGHSPAALRRMRVNR